LVHYGLRRRGFPGAGKEQGQRRLHTKHTIGSTMRWESLRTKEPGPTNQEKSTARAKGRTDKKSAMNSPGEIGTGIYDDARTMRGRPTVGLIIYNNKQQEAQQTGGRHGAPAQGGEEDSRRESAVGTSTDKDRAQRRLRCGKGEHGREGEYKPEVNTQRMLSLHRSDIRTRKRLHRPRPEAFPAQQLFQHQGATTAERTAAARASPWCIP
jgi:hypothetical protein